VRLAILLGLLLFPAALASCASDRPSSAEAAAPGTGQDLTKSELLDGYVRAAIEDWNVPGLAIAVVKDGAVFFAEGYGVQRLGAPEPVDARTLFGLLSPTKTFTTTALAMLVEEGRLSWNDPVIEHLPHFRVSDPRTTRDLRIRDLVSNRSGYQDAPRLWYGTRHGSKDLVRLLADQEPASPLGAEFHYNNLMFVVAGEVIEAVSGMSWEAFVSQRIFVPLGMAESTTSVRALAGRSNLASPHSRRIFNRVGPVRPIPYFDADNVGPAGMIHTNVHEMTAWLRLHLDEGAYPGGRLLEAASVRALQQPHIGISNPEEDDRLGGERAFGPVGELMDSVAYGLGWFTASYRGHAAVFHGGGLNGQRSAVGLLPDQNLGVVILSNMQDTEIALALMYQVFDLFLNVEPRNWSAEYRHGG